MDLSLLALGGSSVASDFLSVETVAGAPWRATFSLWRLWRELLGERLCRYCGLSSMGSAFLSVETVAGAPWRATFSLYILWLELHGERLSLCGDCDGSSSAINFLSVEAVTGVSVSKRHSALQLSSSVSSVWMEVVSLYWISLVSRRRCIQGRLATD